MIDKYSVVWVDVLHREQSCQHLYSRYFGSPVSHNVSDSVTVNTVGWGLGLFQEETPPVLCIKVCLQLCKAFCGKHHDVIVVRLKSGAQSQMESIRENTIFFKQIVLLNFFMTGPSVPFFGNQNMVICNMSLQHKCECNIIILFFQYADKVCPQWIHAWTSKRKNEATCYRSKGESDLFFFYWKWKWRLSPSLCLALYAILHSSTE